MVILELDHVQLAMPSGKEEAARAFYRDILGMEEEDKPAHLAGRGGVWFSMGPVKLHLGVDPDFKPAKKAHPALLVKDLPDMISRCQAAGFEPSEDAPLHGYKRVYVADPFGNRIELMEKDVSH